jgi:hypothetical protein
MAALPSGRLIYRPQLKSGIARAEVDAGKRADDDQLAIDTKMANGDSRSG